MVFLYIFALLFVLHGINSNLLSLIHKVYAYGFGISAYNLVCMILLAIFCVHGLWNSWKAWKKWRDGE